MIMHECYQCTNRTTNPNCHNPKLCEKWAAHIERQKRIYAEREEESRLSRPLAKFSKSKGVYYDGELR